jgi:RNA polymerase-binding transcription factor DksA
MSRIEHEARSLLLQRRQNLCRQLVEPGHADPSAHWHDWETVAEPLAEPVRRELAEIERALRRIDDGSYGLCQACGGPMGMQRIRAIPEARYCVSCSGGREAAD